MAGSSEIIECRRREVKLYQGDCESFLLLEVKRPNLLFVDPPFNINYGYDEFDDNVPANEYLAWLKRRLALAVELLATDGSVVVVIGDERAAEVKLMLDSLGLTMRNWIIWHYTFGQHCSKKFGRDHCHLLYYVKDAAKFTFNADAVRVESERQRIGDKRANPKGRVPGDVWTFSRLPGNAKERVGHPCQLPEELVRRVVRACSNPGDTVLDCFAGSGTTAAVAVQEGRDAVLCELSGDYCGLIRERLRKLNEGAQ